MTSVMTDRQPAATAPRTEATAEAEDPIPRSAPHFTSPLWSPPADSGLAALRALSLLRLVRVLRLPSGDPGRVSPLRLSMRLYLPGRWLADRYRRQLLADAFDDRIEVEALP